MTIEEKSKAYDKAIEKIKYVLGHGVSPVLNKEDLQDIFPELSESEDEKVRKALAEMVHDTTGDELWVDYNVHKEEALAWLEKQGEKQQKTSIWKHWKDGIAGNGEGEPIYLIKYGRTYSLSSCLGFECDYIELSELDKLLSEKQGEQKPTDKVEPKFKVGDWIVDKSRLAQQVLDFRGGIYTCTYNSFIIDCESNYHLWTIQDAKDGDVLALKNDTTHTIICMSPTTCDTGSYCGLRDGYFIKNKEYGWASVLLTPATKEQRDLLFQKMHKAGYEWDAEKKELKKIEQKSQRMISAEAKEAMYANLLGVKRMS